jgi:glutathione S-transferase
MSTIKLYRHALSGHSHRVELFLSLLNSDYELVDVDLVNGEHKQPEFLSLNRFGQVPVLEDGESVISDSNAILVYLARKYDTRNTWLPGDPGAAAEVQRFLSVAAGQVIYGPATAIAHQVFDILEDHLANRDWLVGSRPTLADVSNYAYIAHAPEGDVSLADYPNVRAWLRRIEELPGFVPMQSTSIGLAA